MKRNVLAILLVILIGALWATPAKAQSSDATNYRLNYYAVGATAPLQQTDVFTTSAVQCNQPAPANVSSVNPTKAFWRDPNNAGRVCTFNFTVGTAVTAFPVGNYEAAIVAINPAGESAESNRYPFSRAALPAARQDFGLTR